MSHRPEWLFTTCFVKRRGPRPLAGRVRSGVHEHVHHIHTTVQYGCTFHESHSLVGDQYTRRLGSDDDNPIVDLHAITSECLL
jgi:hypothetical protein